MKKRLFFVALLAFFLYQIFALVNSKEETLQISQHEKAQLGNLSNIPTQRNSPDLQASDCKSAQIQLNSKNALISISSYDEKLHKVKLQALEDIEVTLARIKTDKGFQDSDLAAAVVQMVIFQSMTEQLAKDCNTTDLSQAASLNIMQWSN